MTTQHFYIEMQDLSKVYPRTLGDQLVAVARSIVNLSVEKTRAACGVEGLTLKIRQGERVGIIGRNGAGKSTLLQMLAGITPPTSGSMKVNGKVTAVLTLGSGLRDDLSGRQNIYLEGEAQGKERKQLDIHAQEIIEFAELGKFIDMPLRTYSTGMKARLAFAMITQIEPEILIIDEALSVGDAAFALKARRRITELCKRGSIVLIVSHSMESIRELCNRCLWLDKGKLVLDGEPELITREYQESVRKEDEAGHTARFCRLIGERSYKKGFALGLLSLSREGRLVTRLVSGGYLDIRCKIEAPPNASLGYAMLRCIRLDGALICENRLELGSYLELSELHVAYPCLNLSPGFYKLCLEWRCVSEEIFADSSAILEVYDEKMQTGGRPILTQVGLVDSFKINNDAGIY